MKCPKSKKECSFCRQMKEGIFCEIQANTAGFAEIKGKFKCPLEKYKAGKLKRKPIPPAKKEKTCARKKT